MRVRSTLAFLLAARAAAEPVERREIRSVDEFRRLARPDVAALFSWSSFLAACAATAKSSSRPGWNWPNDDAAGARAREY